MQILRSVRIRRRPYWTRTRCACVLVTALTACEDTRYAAEATDFADVAAQVLTERGVCPTPAECGSQEYVFHQSAHAGAEVDVYGVTDDAILTATVAAVSRRFLDVPQCPSVRLRFFSDTKRVHLAQPKSPPPSYTLIVSRR